MEWQGHRNAVGLQCVVCFYNFFFPSLIGYYADVFDGSMIVLAMYTLNLFHPGIYLREEHYSSQTSSGSESVDMKDRLSPNYYQGQAV
jgi:hypothetical protein